MRENKLIYTLLIILPIELIFISFSDIETTMFVNLFNGIVLFAYVLYKILSDVKAIYLAFLGYALFSFFDMFKSYYLFSLDYSFDKYYLYAVYYVYLSLFLFLLGYRLTGGNKSFYNNSRKLNEKLFLLIIVPVGLILIIPTILITTQSPIILLLSFFPKSIPIISFYFYLKNKKSIHLIIISFFTMFAFMEISRRVYITYFIILLVLYISFLYNKHGSIKIKHKLLFLSSFTLMTLFMGYLRVNDENSTEQNNAASRAIENISEMRAIDTYDNTAFILRTFPDKFDYYYGETYLAILVQFIPRSLWPEKIVSLGAPLGLMRKAGIQDWSVDKWKFYVNNHSYSPGFIGEAYANFGVSGVVLLSFLFGRYTKKFDLKIRADNAIVSIKTIPYLAFYSSFFLISRGDLLMATYYSILFFLFLKIIIRIIYK